VDAAGGLVLGKNTEEFFFFGVPCGGGHHDGIPFREDKGGAEKI